jgi:hypothetical protein
VNEQDYDDFMGTAAEIVLEMEDDVLTVFMVSEGLEGLRCMAIENDEGLSARVIAQIDQMMATRPIFTAMATKVGWTPDESDTTPAWFLVGVDPEREAYFCVKRIAEDDTWWRLKPEDVPWFGLSTAGSLRDAMVHGTPLRPKNANENPNLFMKPTEEPDPGTDAQGNL